MSIKTALDSTAVRELELYIDNTSELYPQKQSIFKNLYLKKDKDSYDPALAPKAMMYLVDAGAKLYLKEFGSAGDRIDSMFPRAERMEVAKGLVAEFEDAYANDEFPEFHSKKWLRENKSAGLKVAFYPDPEGAIIQDLLEEAGLEDTDVDDISVVENGRGATVRIDDEEYWVFPNYDAAEREAVEYAGEAIDEGLMDEGFISDYLHITDTDRRIMAGEEQDHRMEDIEDEDDLIRMANEYDLDDTDYRDEDDVLNDTKLRSDLEEAIYDRHYAELDDPIQYFVHDQGIYTMEELMKASFISVDREEAAQAAVDVDGVAHFIAFYDGEEVPLVESALAYRIN